MEKAKTIAALIEEDKKREHSTLLQTPLQPTHGEERPEGLIYNEHGDRNSRRIPRWEESREVTCWACNKKGHMVRNCPLWYRWRENQGDRRNPMEQRKDRRRERNEQTQLNW